jgi:hypothetical protein
MGGCDNLAGTGTVPSSNCSAGVETVLGGTRNTASSDTATVSGGELNIASGFSASVLGGEGNTASGDCGSIPASPAGLC